MNDLEKLKDLLKERNKKGRLKPLKCIECGNNYADFPSKLCPGCEAYREHQS